MKINSLKNILLMGAVLIAASLQAQVDINLSGAVAFRETSYRAIRSIFGPNLVSQNPADGPATPNELKLVWTGTIPGLFGNQPVTLRAFYNGANAGIQDLTQNRNVQFLASAIPGDTNVVNLPADLAYSSVFQRSTIFTTPVLEDVRFGVTPVYFVKSTTAPAGLTNITSQQYRTLAANGSVPGWFLTGNTNDTELVYFVNRDPTAGQRTITQRESGFTGNPIFYTWDASIGQFVIDPTGRTATQIRDLLNVSGPAVSYLTGIDAFNVNGGANILAFNGRTAFVGAYSEVSNNFDPVTSGTYSQWGYEHIFNRPTASANIKAFRDRLIEAIDIDLATSAFSIPISRMNVERAAEGGPISPIE
ncbi:MAG: hypothetical protein KF791_10755 [Verrucomicrobiae bacterium]|nr:hypothetical protein [Verrucomicrobiae bacterium]